MAGLTPTGQYVYVVDTSKVQSSVGAFCAPPKICTFTFSSTILPLSWLKDLSGCCCMLYASTLRLPPSWKSLGKPVHETRTRSVERRAPHYNPSTQRYNGRCQCMLFTALRSGTTRSQAENWLPCSSVVVSFRSLLRFQRLLTSRYRRFHVSKEAGHRLPSMKHRSGKSLTHSLGAGGLSHHTVHLSLQKDSSLTFHYPV